MDEAARIQQQIDYWQGRIDNHLEQEKNGSSSYNSNWAPSRGSPYGVRRPGRAQRGARGGYRNKSLTVRKPISTPPDPLSQAKKATPETATSTEDFVSTTGRHMQLINSSIYDRVTQQRNKDVEKTLAARRQARTAKEAARLKVYFAQAEAQNKAHVHEIDVHGVRFRVCDGGSKLIKVSDLPLDLVPKRATVGGVTFFRSKHGNLYRAGIVKPKRSRVQKSSDLCATFSTTGSCPNGPTCRYTHDPDKVAICKDFLQKGSCPAGDFCDLSHDPTPHRVPACIHFLRGKCTKDDCRYAHVKVSPGAPVCRAFALLGYCDKGSLCSERHVSECPDYANKGFCRNVNCRLPHVDRAGQLRKTAPAAGPVGNTPSSGSSDPSSDEEEHSDDIDSDEDVFVQGIEGAGVDLTGNKDFIGF